MSFVEVEFQGTDVMRAPLRSISEIPNDTRWRTRTFRIPNWPMRRVRKDRVFYGTTVVRNKGGRIGASKLLKRIKKRPVRKCWKRMRRRLEARDQDLKLRTRLRLFFEQNVPPELQNDLTNAHQFSKLKTLFKRQKRIECQIVEMLGVCLAVREGENSPLKIAEKTKVHVSRVRRLLRTLQRPDRTFFEKKITALQSIEMMNRKLVEFFDSLWPEDLALSLSLKELYAKFALSLPDPKSISLQGFYHAMRELQFRFRSVKFERPVKYPVAPAEMRDFLDLFVFLLFNENKFLLVFVDESSIHPNNFKKRAWRRTGSRGVVRSRVGYEKVMLVGAMSSKELLALQFIRSGFCGDTFAHFIFEVLRELRVVREEKRTVIVFADNATIHVGENVQAICAHFQSVLLLNLPAHPALNPIELLWEFLKRPFRTRSSYPKSTQQQSHTPQNAHRKGEISFKTGDRKLHDPNLHRHPITLQFTLINLIFHLIFFSHKIVLFQI